MLDEFTYIPDRATPTRRDYPEVQAVNEVGPRLLNRVEGDHSDWPYEVKMFFIGLFAGLLTYAVSMLHYIPMTMPILGGANVILLLAACLSASFTIDEIVKWRREFTLSVMPKEVCENEQDALLRVSEIAKSLPEGHAFFDTYYRLYSQPNNALSTRSIHYSEDTMQVKIYLEWTFALFAAVSVLVAAVWPALTLLKDAPHSWVPSHLLSALTTKPAALLLVALLAMVLYWGVSQVLVSMLDAKLAPYVALESAGSPYLPRKKNSRQDVWEQNQEHARETGEQFIELGEIHTPDGCSGPFLAPLRDVESMVIFGGSGTGKSSRWITPYAQQLVALMAIPGCEASYLNQDLKASDSLLPETLRIECDERGIDFKILNLSGGPSNAFNIFADPRFQEIDPSDQADTVCQSLGLLKDSQFGVYGEQFFGDNSADAARRVFEAGPPESWQDLLRRLETTKFSAEERKASQHLIVAVRTLAAERILNVTEQNAPNRDVWDRRIILSEMLYKPRVLHTALPTGYSRKARAAAFMALACPRLYATRDGNNPKRIPLHIALDDFSAIAATCRGHSDQTRGLKFPTLYSTQHPGQLEQDFLDSLRENSTLEVTLSMLSQQQRKDQRELSGDSIDATLSSSYDQDGEERITVSEFVTTGLTRREQNAISADSSQAWLRAKTENWPMQLNPGGARVTVDYSLTKKEYTKRLNAPAVMHRGAYDFSRKAVSQPPTTPTRPTPAHDPITSPKPPHEPARDIAARWSSRLKVAYEHSKRSVVRHRTKPNPDSH